MRSLYQELCGISFKIAQNDFMYTKHIVSSVDSQEDIAALFSLWQKLYAEFFIRGNALDSSVYVVLGALDETFADNRLALFKCSRTFGTEEGIGSSCWATCVRSCGRAGFLQSISAAKRMNGFFSLLYRRLLNNVVGSRRIWCLWIILDELKQQLRVKRGIKEKV